MSQRLRSLPSEVAKRIGPYYVYVLVDPRNDSIFYVGKGREQRLLAHGYEARMTAGGPRSRKIARIQAIHAAGREPRIDVVRHGLREGEALRLEAVLLDCLGDLTNENRGHGASDGRSSLRDLLSRYGATQVDQDARPVVLIRLKDWIAQIEEIEPGTFREGHGYRSDLKIRELVDSTRAWWKTFSPHGVEKRGVRHAVAVHNGVTRAVMDIGDWMQREDRWTFAATPITNGAVYDEWVGPLGRRVPFTQGSRNPTRYWPLKS